MAKLNVWIRNRQCEVMTRKEWHLDVFTCCNKRVLQTWFTADKVPPFVVDVPPGCYLVTAGLAMVPGGNYYTDWAMVVVKCEEDTCVNLVMNDYKRTAKDIAMDGKPVFNLIQQGCAGRIIIPFIVNAAEAGIRPEEVKKTLAVLAKASDLDLKQVNTAIKAEIEECKKYGEKTRSKESEKFYGVLEEYLG